MEPVRQFLRLLVERIDKEASSRTEQLLDGKSITDMAAYRERVGYLQAMRHVKVWLDEIFRDMTSPEAGQNSPNRAIRPRSSPTTSSIF